ncbi:MAG TPA: archaeosortase/exosortase family protein [Thermoplasmata archaeon]
MVLMALITTFAGVALLVDRPKGSVLEWVALPLVAFGGAIFVWQVWPQTTQKEPSRNHIFDKILSRFRLDNRRVSVFPALGAAIVLTDIAYNVFLSANPQLLTEDTIAILLGATLLVHPLVPDKYARERDFVLAFFVLLNLILVAPLLLSRAFYQDFQRSVDVYSWVALAPETSGVLSMIGVSNTVHPVSGATAPGLTFVPLHVGAEVTIVITTACSGIYSFGIFASAFAAFVMTEYEKPSKRLWVFLGLGLITSYIANVLRMVVIILVGYYTDTGETDLQHMLIAHSYAGWLIFLAWIALFWSLLFRFLPQTGIEGNPRKVGRSAPSTLCWTCKRSMSLSIPGRRCSCGRYYHIACAPTGSNCVGCGLVLRAGANRC